MAVTRLERKLKRDRAKSKRRIATIKRLNAVPPMKNIDIEAIKAEFEKNKGGAAKKKEESKAAPKGEPKTEVKAETKVEVTKPEVEQAPAKEEKAESKATQVKAEKAETPAKKEPAKKEKKAEDKADKS